MTPRRVENRRHKSHNSINPSDYESDFNNLSDVPSAPVPSRTNAELNLSVIRRHNPDVINILSIASYAVVYLFSPTALQWEKSGIEGTLFVCQLASSNIGAERYAVVVLNRRGLENFYTELLEGSDVEITEEYVILRVTNEGGDPHAYGLWIFSEPPPSSTANTRALNAQIIRDCAVQAETSRKLAKEVWESENQKPIQPELIHESAPMGRQFSLQQLFGQQREQDSGWSVKAHSPVSTGAPQFMSNPDTDFFHSAKRHGMPQAPPPEQGKDVLAELFRKAGEGYRQSVL
ncbi:PH domain-like protein [Xylona heveae TC161]|uniref:PH domain-like protein n=1 Tax=Xylona heveae (strain CBS 132557 / TC161) TaxID=1328760 RepID=A0A164ZIM9_XYLHT|nr:PH domain-like protein [Xylona heveae TC161]KZF19145.1 PH domain-like protein [Xylona heveae TC161]